jgi:hypothetical protein
MTVDFTCQRCDGSFEVEFVDLIEEGKLQCPNCDQRAPGKIVEELAGTLDELFSRVAELRSKFLLSLAVESDDLPPPYDEGKSAAEDDEDDDDEDDDEDLDDEPDEDDDDDEGDDEDDR